MCTSTPAAARPCDKTTAPQQQPHDQTDARRRQEPARRPRTESSLAHTDRRFRALAEDNEQLAVDGRILGHGLPARMINLLELRKLLLKASTSFEARDAVWRHLIRQARSGDPSWVVGAVGVAMPALKRRAADLAAGFGQSTVDLDAELLSGFLHALRHADIDPPRVITRLISPAYVAARRLREAELQARGVAAVPASRTYTRLGDNHPDIALDRAVAAGVLSELERDVISATCVGGQSLTEYAAEKGRSYEAVRLCRYRGIKNLERAFRPGVLRAKPEHDADIICDATMTVAWPADED